jgi:hypothetical protein
MKKERSAKTVRRQIFVLTAEEQRIICFVVVALLLGLATKHYRETRPSPIVTGAIGQTVTAVSRPVDKRPVEKRPDR